MTYDELYTEMLPKLTLYAKSRYSYDRASAEDIAQEAFLRLWKHWPDKLERQKAAQQRTWLYRAATSICIDLGRRRQSLQRRGAEMLSLDMALSLGDDPRDMDAYSDPERVLAARDAWADMMSYCNRRSRHASATFAALKLHATGWSIEAAAARTGTTPGALKMALCRARAALAEVSIEAETEEGMVAA